MPPFHQRAFAELRPTLEGLGFSLAVEHFDHHAFGSVYVGARRRGQMDPHHVGWEGKHVARARLTCPRERVDRRRRLPGSPPTPVDRDLDDERIERLRDAIERIAEGAG